MVVYEDFKDIKSYAANPAVQLKLPDFYGDKPLNNEIYNCSSFFNQEMKSLKNLKVIVTLGKVAFDNCVKLYKIKFDIKKNLFLNMVKLTNYQTD